MRTFFECAFGIFIGYFLYMWFWGWVFPEVQKEIMQFVYISGSLGTFGVTYAFNYVEKKLQSLQDQIDFLRRR